MKKDHIYYEGRQISHAKAAYAKLAQNHTAREIRQIFEDNAFPTLDERMSRIGVNLHEAFAIIRMLLSDPEPSDPNKVYHIEWIDRMSAIPKDAKGDLLQQDWTRAQMLERLHWIASEEFGEDLEEWRSWMTAFLENPPAWGWR